MNTNLAENKKTEIDEKSWHDGILSLESAMAKAPGATFGDTEMLPLKHSFAEGVYVREIFIPKGTVLTGKIHRHSHPNFLMKGEVIVATEFGGREHLKAPLSMISKAGTKRAIYAIEDTVWITVHVTNETDLEKIEEYVISPTYEQLAKVEEKPMIESELSSKNCLILALKKKNRDYKHLLNLKSFGTHLPFKEALESLRKENISTEGLFAIKQKNGLWHITTDEGIPLESVSVDDSDLVGTWAAVAIGGATLGSAAMTTFGKKNTVEEPKEIGQARRLLLEYGSTGKLGDYTAGQDIGIGYGNYDMTGLEKTGQSNLQALLTSGIPDQYRIGDMALQDLLQTSPEAIDKQFNPYKTQAMRSITESQDALKRSAAYAGGLYSSRTLKGLGDIQAKGNETLLSKLADLTNEYQNRKLSAIPLAYQSAQGQEALNLNRIGAAYQYGSLARDLNNASVAERNAELIRRRNEKSSQVSALSATLNGQYQTPISQSPYAQLLGTIGQIGGNYLGNKMMMSQYDQYLNPSSPTSSISNTGYGANSYSSTLGYFNQ